MDKKRIAVAFLIVLTNTIGATAILPMLPLYVENRFGATPVQATFAIAAFYAAQFFAAPWLGRLSDTIGRRPVLIISQVGTILSYVIFIFASRLGQGVNAALPALGISGGLAVIYLARLADGLTGGNVSVAEAYASDISDDRSRAQALGLIGGAVGLGHILGPILAVVLSGPDLLGPIIGATVMSTVTLLLTAILLKEPLKQDIHPTVHAAGPERSTWYPRAPRPILLILAAAMSMSLYIAAALSSLSLYTERVTFVGQPSSVVVRNTGMMIVVMGLVAAVGQTMLVGRLTRRWSEPPVIVLGSGLLLVSAVGLGAAESIASVVMSIVAYGIGYALAWPSLQTLVTRFGARESAGRLLGLFQSIFSLALIVSPLGAGLLLETSGPRTIFTAGAALMVLAFVLAVAIMHFPLPDGPEKSGGEQLRRSWVSLHGIHR